MEEVLALNAELVAQNSELEAKLAVALTENRALHECQEQAKTVFANALGQLMEVKGLFDNLVRENAQTQLVVQELRRTNAMVQQQLEHRCAVYVQTIQRLAVELGEQADRTRDYEFICRSFQQAREYILNREYTESAVLLYAMIRGRR